jgi:hypothetical protein
MNLDFFAKGPFNTFVDLVNQFTALWVIIYCSASINRRCSSFSLLPYL